MTDEIPPGFDEDESNVIAIRHPETGAPVVIPREVALQESRPYRAYCDYLSGVGWEVIAERYEYVDARAAQYDIGQYVESARSLYNQLTVHQRKALQLARLEHLMNASWESATRGSLPAINTARQLIVDMIKLEKLDQVEEDDPDGKKQTVIIDGAEEDFVAGLERASRD